jgi:hypothetical protein
MLLLMPKNDKKFNDISYSYALKGLWHEIFELFISWIDRSKDMIKLQIYHFPFFGEFAELLANSNLLAALLNVASKIFFS